MDHARQPSVRHFDHCPWLFAEQATEEQRVAQRREAHARKFAAARGVVRERSDQDKRSFVVVLTAEGIRRAEAAFREDMGRELRFLDALDEGERRALSGLLRKLAGSLEPAEGEVSAADSV